MRMWILLMLVLSMLSAPVFAQDFWQKQRMEPQLSIYSLCGDGFGNIYAGGYGQGIFRTNDNGGQWDSAGLAGYWGVAMAANTVGDMFLVGIGNTRGSGLFRLQQQAESWDKILDLNDYGGINCVHVAEDSAVWVGLNYSPDYNGLYKSEDNGETWTPVYIDTKNFYALTTKSGGRIFAASYGRIYRSPDNGAHWDYSEQGLSASEIRALAVNSLGQIFAASSGYGIYRSDDDGVTWNRVYSAGPDFSCMVIDQAQTIYAGTRGNWIYSSANNGNTWSPLKSGLTNPYTLSLTISESGYLFAGTDTSGVFRSKQPVVTEIPESIAALQDYQLGQNYPNPFNPDTRIEYRLNKPATVNLSVFNALGQTVQTLVNRRQQSGRFAVSFNGADLPSSVYFYRLSTEDGYIQTRKMLLLR